jgi:plasmid stabilization system protein ParE
VYSVIFTQAARAELIEAQDWYEGEATGLGRRFRQGIDALIERMSDNPRQAFRLLPRVRHVAGVQQRCTPINHGRRSRL